MSAIPPVPPDHTDAAAGRNHASVATYVKVAVILTLVTAMEFSAIYIRQLTPILIPLLLVMSAAKFAIVVMFYMHLKYDHPLFRALFTGPLLIAIVTMIILLFLFGHLVIHV